MAERGARIYRGDLIIARATLVAGGTATKIPPRDTAGLLSSEKTRHPWASAAGAVMAGAGSTSMPFSNCGKGVDADPGLRSGQALGRRDGAGVDAGLRHDGAGVDAGLRHDGEAVDQTE